MIVGGQTGVPVKLSSTIMPPDWQKLNSASEDNIPYSFSLITKFIFN